MNYKLPTVGLITAFFLLVNIIGVPITKSYGDSYWFDPEDITLEDNAYNITDYFSLQWWYIDAVFDNNYSIHIGIMTIGSKGISGFFLFQINVYKEGELLEKKFKFVPERFVDTSQSEPLIKLLGKDILRGYIDDEDRMALDVSLEIKGLKADLKFTSLTKGWKGFTGYGMWSCPIPKAEVQGNITVKGDIITVNGTGYQEHGWDVRHLHRNWYWGKFFSDSNSVIFSQNMKNRWQEDIFLVVVNSGEENYTSIARENITFNHMDFKFNHGRLIPLKSIFQIDEKDIHIDVVFNVQSIHFSSIVLLNYWRFHIRVTGTISVNGIVEEVDDEFQIMEILHYP